MKVCVFGLWHLGTVTAACLAGSGHHHVVGLDFDEDVVSRLNAGQPPLFEPGLEDLVRRSIAAGSLRFTTDAAAVSDAELVWVAFDTPVDDDDRADVEYVMDRVCALFPHLRDGALVLISSQLPVGSTRTLEERFHAAAGGRTVGFAYSPENLRLGKALSVFSQPDRVVAGVRSATDRERIAALLEPFTDRIEWMSVESAEMTKHALNAFLATSVTFINEIAGVCERVGADAAEVERGLKSESRIGPKAYLSPGAAFAGGTLARDVAFLSQIGLALGQPTELLRAVRSSNDAHKQWAQRRLLHLLGEVRGRTIAVWGLTYKPGTDTLRRSTAVELCRWLIANGAAVRVHDPAVKELPDDLAGCCRLFPDPLDAAAGASALVVCTAWPEYRSVPAARVAAVMREPCVLDANRFLGGEFQSHPGIRYASVGRG